MQDLLTSYFWSGDSLRSRSVGHLVLSSELDIPAPSARLAGDLKRQAACLELEPGDVEALSLPRARVRWPDYRHCVQAVADWMGVLGLPDLLAGSSVALMACRGARYHHDGGQYGAAAFCNLFLSEDGGLDLHFPLTGQRIPLARGSVVIFDTGQPHAVIRRGSSGFDAADFPAAPDCTQLFLTWELPVEDEDVGRALGVVLDIGPCPWLPLHEGQVWRNGAAVQVCPDTGGWELPGTPTTEQL